MFWTSTHKPQADLNKPFELYSGHTARYLTVTGMRANKLTVAHINGELAGYVAKYKEVCNQNSINTNTPLPQFTDIKNLEPIAHLGLTPGACDFLINNAPQGERSELLYHAISDLYNLGLSDEDVLGYLTGSEAANYAIDKYGEGAARRPH